MEDFVSVIIPTYGRPKTLKRAVNSVLNQTYHNIEVIVVDDNNPNTVDREETEKVIEDFPKDVLKYIQHPENLNGSAARNTGAKNAIGKYLMFLDDDDEFLPEKVERQLNNLKNTKYKINYCSYVRKYKGKLKDKSKKERFGNLYLDALSRNLFIAAGSNLMIERDIFFEVGGFDETFQRNQDLELLTKVIKKHEIAHVDYYGLIVHTHRNKKGDFVKITEHFISTFSKEIEGLNEKDLKYFYTCIKLQLFRHYLLKKKKPVYAFRYLKVNNIKVRIGIKYLFHLLNRRITKKTYGFKLQV